LITLFEHGTVARPKLLQNLGQTLKEGVSCDAGAGQSLIDDEGV